MDQGHLPIPAERQDGLPVRKDLPAGENLNEGGFSVFEELATSGSSFPIAGGMVEETQIVFAALYSKPALGVVTPPPILSLSLGEYIFSVSSCHTCLICALR